MARQKSVVVQIAQASAKPPGWSASHRAERTAVQTEGARVSSMGAGHRSHVRQPLRVRGVQPSDVWEAWRDRHGEAGQIAATRWRRMRPTTPPADDSSSLPGR